PDHHPWARDGRAAPARPDPRRPLGRDGRRDRDPRLDARLRRRLAGRPRPHSGRGAIGGERRRAEDGRLVKVVVVSGIWPPDVGGPASHAPALAAALLDAGHAVEVVTTADHAPEARPYPVRWISRARSAPLRHLAVAREVARAARRSDRVYATSMVRRSALGAAVARRPLVVKLVSDEAFERAARS